MSQITTFLMFEGRAEEAMRLYISLFPDSEILSITYYGEETPESVGMVQHALFTLNGQMLMCIDSSVKHGFTFTPAMSLHVTCRTEHELDALYAGLSEGGGVLMPLDAYPFATRYAWVNDRFGVSWQLMLA